ncbi:MAG: methyltransferase domain-containing protein [Acidobacteriota bacterium]|nr:methyltransferase domain-containing protein [Acidobacteriota bacterium]
MPPKRTKLLYESATPRNSHFTVAHNVRRFLHGLSGWLARFDRNIIPEPPEPPLNKQAEIEAFLRRIDYPDDGARRYVEIHMERFLRTLTMVPPPSKTGRALELGAYMQMTPVLGCVLGYSEVRGGYFGKLGRTDEKTVSSGGREVFRCRVDQFDAEIDLYPYPDESFDTILACEIFEHFLHDPMHMLIESRRVLIDGGTLILTTPNVVSYTAVARVLEMSGNPQLYSMYPDPRGEYAATEVGHMREYTPAELEQVVRSAGFEVQYLFTKIAPGYNSYLWVPKLLERNNATPILRGEQMFLLARKKSGMPIERYPPFLYEGM